MQLISKSAAPGADAPSQPLFRRLTFQRCCAQGPLWDLVANWVSSETIRRRGVDIPLPEKEKGHYVLSVVVFGKGPPRVDRGPNSAASHLEWTLLEGLPDLSNGGPHVPCTDDGLLRFDPPKDFSACTDVTLGGACDGSTSDPRKASMKLRANWGHASAHQLKRALMDSEGDNSRLANYVDEVLEHCETFRAFDKARQFPIAGT